MRYILILPLFLLSINCIAQQRSQDIQMITNTIENYFDGYVERNLSKLEKAFDLENGVMKLHRTNDDGIDYVENIPFKELIPRWASREKLSKTELENCVLNILNIDIVKGEIASAKISMRVSGTTYIDILSLNKMNQNWKITNKIFFVLKD
ncbi:MAG: hypothetical protein HKO67_07080 [Flavobacteriaceae bacterium]|nr:hypothetical protein [Flavobacteriaceae bacterium]